MSSVRIRPGTLVIKKKDWRNPVFFLTPSRPPTLGGSRAPCAPSHRPALRCSPHGAFAPFRPYAQFSVFRPLPSPYIRGKSCSVRPIPCFQTPPVPSKGKSCYVRTIAPACASLFSARRFCAFFSSVCFEYNKFCLHFAVSWYMTVSNLKAGIYPLWMLAFFIYRGDGYFARGRSIVVSPARMR